MHDSEVGSLLTYWLYGIEHNVFSTGMAQHWAATAQRGRLASPELAGIAEAKDREAVLDALRHAIAGRYAIPASELPSIGRTLFGYIADELGEGKISLRDAIHSALQIAERTGQPKEAGDKFRHLSDTYFKFFAEVSTALRSCETPES
jgi:hypothetical protein